MYAVVNSHLKVMLITYVFNFIYAITLKYIRICQGVIEGKPRNPRNSNKGRNGHHRNT